MHDTETARQLQRPGPGGTTAGAHAASACFMTLFLLAGLCAVALCCELSGCLRAAQAEKPLRSEPLLPKLDRGEPPAPDIVLPVPELQPSAPVPSQEDKFAPPPLPPVVETITPQREEPSAFFPPPPLALTPVVPAPPPAPDLCSDPVVYVHPCGSQPSESPMIRNWRTLALCSLVAVVPAAPVVVAQELPSKELDKINQRLQRLEEADTGIQRDLKQIDEVRKSLQALPTLSQADLDRMNKRLEAIDDIRNDLRAIDLLQASVAQLGSRVKALEERKGPPAVAGNGTGTSGNQEVRGDIRKLEGILNQIVDLQKSMETEVQGVRRDVSGLKKDVTALQGDQAGTKLRLDAIDLQINRLTDDLKTLQRRLDSAASSTTIVGSSPAPAAVERALDDIRSKLGAIEQAILRLQPASTRSAFYPTPGLAAPTAGIGRVLLENYYPEDMLFIVNGKETRVLPNQIVALESIPTGALTYEVVSPSWGRRMQKTTTLASNETFRITAR